MRNFTRVGILNENKNTNKQISVAAKRNITLNFLPLDIPILIGRTAGISKKILLCPFI